MTPERWQQIDRLLNEVLERDPMERAAYLTEAAAGDNELRREVESLLGFHQKASGFIETPPADIAADWLVKTETRTDQTIGHYKLIRELGRGGMGVVYLANDTRLGRRVALKLLLEKLTQDAARVRRFQREARAVSALNHPNIITVYEVGQTSQELGGEHFIAAEFVDGRTLREQSKSGGMPLVQALDVLIQTCAALASAHEAGIIHRDIKPENIMLRRDGIVKVLDFGLAKLIELTPRPTQTNTARLTTQPGVVMGTTSYMSPEQARGMDVDARSDLFSLGVVMYELLTSHAPFTGETTADVLAALLLGEPRPLNRYSSKLPVALQEIVNRCLAKQPEHRYQSAREVGDELKRLKDELEFSARLNKDLPENDNVLAMNVGAIKDFSEQTTFATRAPAAELAVPAKLTTLMPAAHKTSSGKLAAVFGGLRNHGKILAAVALLIVGLLGWRQYELGNRTSNEAKIDSVAVLPLANRIGDPQLEYLPDGITESLIDGLSQLPDLTVRPASMVWSYKGNEVDPIRAGAALKADVVVAGDVSRKGERLIVEIRMLRTKDGKLLWSEKYEGQPAGILAIQEEISHELANAMRTRSGGAQESRATKSRTQNSEAYKLYTIGRTLWLKRSSETTLKAIEMFQQAIKLDDSYALAYVGMADAYSTLGSYRQMLPHEAYSKARQAAEQALKLDAQLAEAHASLGKILTDSDWDWTRAEAEFHLAISLKPNYANAHHWYSTLLSAEGRFDESIREVKRAQGLDFLSPVTNTHVGNILYRARRYDEAIATLKETLELEPNFLAARVYLGLCYRNQKRLNEALAEFQKGRLLVPNSPDIVALLGSIYAEMGDHNQARRYLVELYELAENHYVSAASFASIYAALGDMDKAFEWIDKAFLEGAPSIRGLKTDPMFDKLRPDPRFPELLRRAGLAN